MQLRTYTPLERNMYMTGLFGQNIIFNMMAAYTTYFMQSVLFLPMSLVGTLLVMAQIWDGINDPIMGTIVDKTRSRWGKCRPYLIFTPVLTGIVTMACFLCLPYDHSPGADTLRNVLIVAWAFGAYILWDLVYTAGDIPLWGISALMTEDEKDRRKLQANARLFAGVGSAIAIVGFQPVAVAVGGSLLKTGRVPEEEASRLGFILVALVFAVVGTVTFQMAGLFTREKIAPSKKENNMSENLKMMWRNRPFRQLLVSGVIAGPRNITNIVAFTLVTYYFAGKDIGKSMIYLVLVGGGLFVGMLGSTGFVPKMLERITKRNLYIAANFLEVIPDLVLFGLYLLSLKMEGGLTSVPMLVLLMVIFTVKGVSIGVFSTVQTNMVADAVDYEDYTNRVRPDGVFFSGQTFLAKISNGISQLIYAGLCSLVMFSGKNVQLMQGLLDKALLDSDPSLLPRNLMAFGSDAVVYTGALGSLTANQIFWCITMMFFAVTVIPAVFSVLAALPMFRYSLSPEKYKQVLTALQERRRAEGEVVEEA